MSLPTPIDKHEGLAHAADGPIMQSVHTGSTLRNLGDLLLTLPAYAVVFVTIDHPTGGVITFRAMAREIPFGHEAERRTERRFTMLDTGTEWFLRKDETKCVIALTLQGQS